MEYLTTILLAIVLVAQIVIILLFFFEKRKNSRRHFASIDYIDRLVSAVSSDLHADMDDLRVELNNTVSEKINQQNALNEERFKRHHDAIMETRNTINAEINGVKLEFTQAQEAAERINDFGASLASIFDYDPIEALQRNRRKEAR